MWYSFLLGTIITIMIMMMMMMMLMIKQKPGLSLSPGLRILHCVSRTVFHVSVGERTMACSVAQLPQAQGLEGTSQEGWPAACG